MSPVLRITRSARLLPELGSAEPIEIAAAPSEPEGERGWMAALLPGLSALGMLGFALLSPNVLIIALCGGVAVLSVVAGVWSARHQRRRCARLWELRRERYLAHLAGCAASLTAAAVRQREHAFAAHPAPNEPFADRLWDRQVGHEDFGRVRLGIGRAPARRPPRLRSAAGDPDGDPELLRRAAGVLARHGAVDDLPVALDVTGSPAVIASFDRLALLRAVIVSLTRSHGPDVLQLHALVPAAEAKWLSLLPHAGCITHDPSELARHVRALLRDPATHADGAPHQAVVLGDDQSGAMDALPTLASMVARHPDTRVSMLTLTVPGAVAASQVTAAVSGDGNGGLVVARSGDQPGLVLVAHPDAVTNAQAQQFAETLAGCQLDDEIPRATNSPLLLADLLHKRSTPSSDCLRIPLGRDDDGAAVTLDLREAARGGDGPHGLVIGSTGTGKSELLRTLLIAAAHQSSPQELAFLLVDYKGGAAFSELARLPHTAGLVTNLNADAHGIDRLVASLRAELRRRQRVLREAGADDIEAYRVRTAVGPAATPALTRLLVVIDEYAELIEESPEALDVLMSLGRLGRSLGIHLLLASQRLDDGRLRGLDAHLRFRLCLRTASAAESVAVIGAPVAARLPAAPGWAWLSRDGTLVRLRVALVDQPAEAVNTELRRWPADCSKPGPTVAPVCLPELPTMLSLGTEGASSAEREPWKACIGLLDLPERGEQRPLRLDLTGPVANLAVAGAPRSGRSTLLASVVAALAESTSPQQLAIHVITAAPSLLTSIAGLPHVGTVATTRELAGQIVTAVADTVAHRQSAAEPSHPRVLLVVDDVAAVLRFDDMLTEQLSKIATAGLSVGVSVALSCGRWTELRGGLRESIGSRWELRMNDPADSMLPQLTRRLPRQVAGRLLTGDGNWAQVALPRADSAGTLDGLAESLGELVAGIARRGGPAVRPIQLLPALVSARALPPTPRHRVTIGVSGSSCDPVDVGLAPGDHLLVLGNSGSGRSGLLRSIGWAAAGWGARPWIIDPRRSLTMPGVGAYRRAHAPGDIVGLLEELTATCLAAGDGQGRAGHRESQVLVIDDLEVVAGPRTAAAFDALSELLPFAVDVGLSVVVARRVSGSNRAAFDPFLARLLELCETGVLLSGDPAEGPVIGGLRPRVRPPGRGQLVLGGEPAAEIQSAWLEHGSAQQNDRAIAAEKVQDGAGGWS